MKECANSVDESCQLFRATGLTGKAWAAWWICSFAHDHLCNSFIIQGGKTEARPFTMLLLGVYHEMYLNSFLPLPILSTPQKSREDHWYFCICTLVHVPHYFSLLYLWLWWMKVFVHISQRESGLRFESAALDSCFYHHLWFWTHWSITRSSVEFQDKDSEVLQYPHNIQGS